jgi:hypothetical protein
MLLNKGKMSNTNNFWKRAEKWVGLLILVGILVWAYLYLEKDIEKIDAYWGYDRLKLLEAKHLWNGVWFNKDEITFGSTGFTIIKRKLFMEKTIQVPYTKVRKVTFKEGEYINTMTIEYDSGMLFGLFGGRASFNVRKLDSFRLVKDYVYGKSENFPVVEETSLIKSFTNALNKKQQKPSDSFHK